MGERNLVQTFLLSSYRNGWWGLNYPSPEESREDKKRLLTHEITGVRTDSEKTRGISFWGNSRLKSSSL